MTVGVRTLRRGGELAVTPDGPRGPRGRVKRGLITIARRTGVPIVPVACRAERAWALSSWDRMVVPKPFSAITVTYHPPVRVDRDADPHEAAGNLGDALNTITKATAC